jgi:hypothetical protein
MNSISIKMDACRNTVCFRKLKRKKKKKKKEFTVVKIELP